MSNSGIIVHNNNGDLVLDNSYLNFYLSRKIALTGTGTTTGTFQTGEYIAAVGGLADASLDAYCENTPTGWSCTVKTYKAGLAVYVFSTNIPKRDHGAGMQVYDASGRIIFDSALEPAKVLTCGHTAQNLPTGSSYKYAMAIGSPIEIKNYQEWYKQDVSRSSMYFPEKWKMEYQKQPDGSYKWVKVVTEEAYWEYTTSWSTTKNMLWTRELKNFRISNSKIELVQILYDKEYQFNTVPFSSGKETSRVTYPVPDPQPGRFDGYYSYVIDPTSFLLFDVSNV